jgi:hypothetical protein
MRTKKYAASVRVSAGVIGYDYVGRRSYMKGQRTLDCSKLYVTDRLGKGQQNRGL